MTSALEIANQEHREKMTRRERRWVHGDEGWFDVAWNPRNAAPPRSQPKKQKQSPLAIARSHLDQLSKAQAAALMRLFGLGTAE